MEDTLAILEQNQRKHINTIRNLDTKIRSCKKFVEQKELEIEKLKSDSIVGKVRGFGDSGIHIGERQIFVSEKSPSQIVAVSRKIQHNSKLLGHKFLEDRYKVKVEFEPTFIAIGKKKIKKRILDGIFLLILK